jgi:hypothetical protein
VGATLPLLCTVTLLSSTLVVTSIEVIDSALRSGFLLALDDRESIRRGFGLGRTAFRRWLKTKASSEKRIKQKKVKSHTRSARFSWTSKLSSRERFLPFDGAFVSNTGSDETPGTDSDPADDTSFNAKSASAAKDPQGNCTSTHLWISFNCDT